MSVSYTIALAALLLEYDHLLTTEVLYDCTTYGNSTTNGGSTDLYIASVIYQEDFVKHKCSVHVTFKPMREDFEALFYFKLLPCDLYDCVHDSNLVKPIFSK